MAFVNKVLLKYSTSRWKFHISEPRRTQIGIQGANTQYNGVHSAESYYISYYYKLPLKTITMDYHLHIKKKEFIVLFEYIRNFLLYLADFNQFFNIVLPKNKKKTHF